MRTKTKIVITMLFSVMLSVLLAFSASAAKVIKRGNDETLEEDGVCSWELYDDGTVVFYGNLVEGGDSHGYRSDHMTELKDVAKSIIVSEGVSHVCANAFYEFTELNEVVFPKSLKELYYAAFCGTKKLESIYIPENVSVFEGNLFQHDWSGLQTLPTSIKNIYVSENNRYYTSIDGVLFTKDKTTLVRYPDGRDETSYTIPSHVTKIADGAFSRADSLKEIIIPDSVTDLGQLTFENALSLERIVIPDSVQEIDMNIFRRCTSLKSITLSKNTSKIHNGYVDFEYCNSLTEINIDDSNRYYTTVDGILFSKDKSVLIRCPSGMRREKYIVPETVTTIERYAFAFTPYIENVVVPRSVKIIKYGAFCGADDQAGKNIYIPEAPQVEEGAVGIKSEIHVYCKDTVYCFEGSYIHNYFMKQKRDYKVSEGFLPKIVLMNEYMYQSMLSNIRINGMLSADITYTLDYDGALRISGTGPMPDFAAGAAPWFPYADKIKTIIIDDGITSVGACAFYGCSGVYGISLPAGITSIGYAAFNGCRGLSGFIVPSSVTTIGDYAFFDCKGLKYVTLYPGIIYIGSHAFDGCSGLERINLPDTITYIGDYAFSSCTSLREMVIPTGVTELRPYVFNMCTGLLKVVIHSKVEVIDYTSFCGCKCHIHGYNGSYAKTYADSLGFSFVALQFIWSDNSDWGTPELKKADELKIFPDVLKEKDLASTITREEFAAVSVKVYESLTGTKALPAIENPFSDTSDIEVLKAYNLGITTGISDTQFAPNSLLTREQAATMLTRVFKKATIPGWEVAKDSEYPLTYDVPAAYWDHANISDWAIESVYFMTANGIINGVGNNKFAPKNTTTEEEANGYANATREQALVIAVRMVEKLAK